MWRQLGKRCTMLWSRALSANEKEMLRPHVRSNAVARKSHAHHQLLIASRSGVSQFADAEEKMYGCLKLCSNQHVIKTCARLPLETPTSHQQQNSS